MSTVILPAGVLDALRDGCRGQIGERADEISDAAFLPPHERDAERLQGPLREQDAIRSLFEVIGWSEDPADQDIRVDLDEHGWALVAVLIDQANTLTDRVQEVEQVDLDRVTRGLAPRREAVLRSSREVIGLALVLLARALSEEGRTP